MKFAGIIQERAKQQEEYINKQIKKRCKANNITQDELAGFIGCSRLSVIGRSKNGGRKLYDLLVIMQLFEEEFFSNLLVGFRYEP